MSVLLNLNYVVLQIVRPHSPNQLIWAKLISPVL